MRWIGLGGANMYGYVLVSISQGDEKSFVEYLKGLDFVREANYLFGEWDVIAKLEAAGPDQLAAFVLDNIRNRPEVKVSSTMIVAQSD